MLEYRLFEIATIIIRRIQVCVLPDVYFWFISYSFLEPIQIQIRYIRYILSKVLH